MARTDQGLAFLSTSKKGEDELLAWQKKYFPDCSIYPDHMNEYKEQISHYLNGDRTSFSIHTDLYGTDFQKLVWNMLRTIPYGKVVTYSDIAERIGKPKAVRAVANAIGKNPILFIIPCHRVIRKDGDLSGFRTGISLKQQLLQLEKAL